MISDIVNTIDYIENTVLFDAILLVINSAGLLEDVSNVCIITNTNKYNNNNII